MGKWIATDIGGTFTDLVAFDESTSALTVAKAPTTPSEFSRGVLDAVGSAELALHDVDDFVHGCTVVINAITERTGVKTALVTTAGFRDVLEIGRGNRPDMYNLIYHKPAPFVPRELRFEVDERVDFSGRVVRPLDLTGLDEIARSCRDEGVQAVAVCLLHAYANPSHEEACRERLSELLDGLSITTSSAITREWREYERTSTTVLNAYVKPVVDRYLGGLEADLEREGFAGAPSVMQSNGGTASFAAGRELPLYLIESGPVAGVIGAAQLGALLGEPNVISLDIGGTTAKCSLVEGRVPAVTTEYRLEWDEQSAGYPAMVPVVDIVEIGAGGGSIAWFDRGALAVGPRSAGAEPGPACYGKGGTEPTVTDAHVVAGMINPDYFLGGALQLDSSLARDAMARLGETVGASAEGAASGVIRLANAKMINALKLVSVRRGYDPRDFVLVASGGGGPMHAAALGAELQAKAVIIPRLPGYFSAWGMLMTQPRIDLLRTRVIRLTDARPADVEAVFRQLESEAQTRFQSSENGHLRFVLSADMRYVGQEHTARVEIASAAMSAEEIAAAFHAAHKRAYTFDLPAEPVELVTFHVAAYRKVSRPGFTPLVSNARSADAAHKGERTIDFGHDGAHACRVYDRDVLPAGFAARGPLIVEEPASTTLVHPRTGTRGRRAGQPDHPGAHVRGDIWR